jgi:hypothetical protein
MQRQCGTVLFSLLQPTLLSNLFANGNVVQCSSLSCSQHSLATFLPTAMWYSAWIWTEMCTQLPRAIELHTLLRLKLVQACVPNDIHSGVSTTSYRCHSNPCPLLITTVNSAHYHLTLCLNIEGACICCIRVRCAFFTMDFAVLGLASSV